MQIANHQSCTQSKYNQFSEKSTKKLTGNTPPVLPELQPENCLSRLISDILR